MGWWARPDPDRRLSEVGLATIPGTDRSIAPAGWDPRRPLTPSDDRRGHFSADEDRAAQDLFPRAGLPNPHPLLTESRGAQSKSRRAMTLPLRMLSPDPCLF